MKRVKAPILPEPVVTDQVVRAAVARGKLRTKAKATGLVYVKASKKLRLEFSDHTDLGIPVAQIPEFVGFTPAELGRLHLVANGTVLRHDKKNIDVSIPGLIAGTQLVAGVAARVAAIRHGGMSSVAKAKAARENGKKGGRPAISRSR